MKKRTDYKIVFDTNVLRSFYEGTELGAFNLKGLPSFVKEHTELHEVCLAVPEMVLKEMAQQDLEDADRYVQQIETASKALQGIGIRISQKAYKRDYLKRIRASYDEAIKNHRIEILPIPQLDCNDLIERAITGKKPFSPRDRKKGRSDKGFKDAVIWQTILEDAGRNIGKSYIFCTDNEVDFPEDILRTEIEKINSKGVFKVFKNIISIKEFLDSEFSLRLDLEKLYSEIEDEIKRKAGSITVQLNRTQRLTPLFSFGGSSLSHEPLYSEDYEGAISRPYTSSLFYKGRKTYDFLDLNIQDISDSNKPEEYIIRAEFFGAVHLIDEYPRRLMSYSSSYLSLLSNEQDSVKFRLKLIYRRKKKEVELLDVENPHSTN